MAALAKCSPSWPARFVRAAVLCRLLLAVQAGRIVGFTSHLPFDESKGWDLTSLSRVPMSVRESMMFCSTVMTAFWWRSSSWSGSSFGSAAAMGVLPEAKPRRARDLPCLILDDCRISTLKCWLSTTIFVDWARPGVVQSQLSCARMVCTRKRASVFIDRDAIRFVTCRKRRHSG